MIPVWAVSSQTEANPRLIEILCDGDNPAREILLPQLVIV